MDDKKLSKFMSLVLRHAPETAGLVLDAQGWVEIDDLARTAAEQVGAGLQDIERVVRESDKQRFVIAGTRIRANQGHSVAVDLGLAAATPPAELWHGTAASNQAGIFSSGLEKRSRQHVHLSADHDTARKVAMRRAGPWIILRVDARAMQASGLQFYRSDNGVWLTEAVPPHFLSVFETFSRPARQGND
ncbi:RNA 2'-phosphotransferase [Labrys sp. ZIDIC5]|uniref:RNA 2'-phosphotransferase n=1 Tax=Labrys sedimenti TaxID=3106036 RepID=UPI002ACA0F7F|nr:RNA 2'-phosphotransferase [Labrys sp. ZIDIC5]MDZ5448193.1 RNA 2'-phosphotransferase [Labrys sp. ZIDIC5]